MERYVLGFWLAGRGALHLWHGNTDQHQRVLESGIFGALTFCPCLEISSIARWNADLCYLRCGSW